MDIDDFSPNKKLEYSQTATCASNFEKNIFKDKLISFLSNTRPYLRLKEFDLILSNLYGLPRLEVVNLFSSVSKELTSRNISVRKLYKLSAAWIYCTNTTQIKKYPNLKNERLLIWCYTGLFNNINVALKYLLYLLRKDSVGVNSIHNFYRKLCNEYNKYTTVDDLLDMVPKIQIDSNCDRITCCLIYFFANTFKYYNSYVYSKDNFADIDEIHSKLYLRLQSEKCPCWKKLILALIKIYLSMGQDTGKLIDKFGITTGESVYYNNIIKACSHNTLPELERVNLKEVKRIIRYSKEWMVLLTESNETIEGLINNITLARNVLFTLKEIDIFDKDEWIASGIWALALISGNHIVRSTTTKMVVSIQELSNPIAEVSLDLLLYEMLIGILRYVQTKMQVLARSGLVTSFIAFLLCGLSQYWQIMEFADAEIVGKLLLHFIPSINPNGEYIYSQNQSTLIPVEVLVKSALKIALPEYILEASFTFIQVRPTDLSKGEAYLQRMAYYIFIYSNIFPGGPIHKFKVFTSYLVRWTIFLSRFSEFTLHQIRLMTAILSNVLSLILRKGSSKMESIVSLVNVIFTAFTSNPALDSMWNKRGRRIESGELMDEISRFLALTYIIYPSGLIPSGGNGGSSIKYCARQTIKGFITQFIKLLPMESRKLPKFSLLCDVFEAEEEQTCVINDKKSIIDTNMDLVGNGDKRRRYNYHFKANDDFIDFETDKNLGMLLVRDELVRIFIFVSYS